MKMQTHRENVPEDALLKTYRGGVRPERWGKYGDCFSVVVDRTVSLADFVFAFYTSPVFRIERLILRALLGTRSSDSDARALADGSAAAAAADGRAGTKALGGAARGCLRARSLRGASIESPCHGGFSHE